MGAFDDFWRAYPPRGAKPHRAGKQTCLQYWKRHNMDQHIDQVLDAIKFYREEWDKKQPPDTQFIPMPITWLRKGLWDVEIPEPEPPRRLSQEEILRMAAR